jgi:hypothetical protein
MQLLVYAPLGDELRGGQLLVYAPLLETAGDGGRRGRDAGDDGGDKGEPDDRAGPGAGREAKPFKW